MKYRNAAALCAITALELGILCGPTLAQEKTLRQQLIGTWTFVVTEATQPDGKKLLPFGPNPKGVNIFTEDGHFVQIQIADGIPKVASNSRVTGTAEENQAVVQGSLALFGTYTVDEAAKLIIYKVKFEHVSELDRPRAKAANRFRHRSRIKT